MNNKVITELIKQRVYPINNLVPLDPPFINDAGSIQNLITNGIESVAVIVSKKDSVRSNHHHLVNSHYLYLISGSIEYFERDLDGSNKIEKIYKAGDMIFTGPKKVHKVVALEDTIMISLAPKSNYPADHDKDTVKENY